MVQLSEENFARHRGNEEVMNMIRKGQVNGINLEDSVSQARFIEEIFGVAS